LNPTGADLAFLLLFASKLVDALLQRDTRHHYAYVIYGTYAIIVMNAVMLASVWLTVVLAAERYVAISQPFLAVKVQCYIDCLVNNYSNSLLCQNGFIIVFNVKFQGGSNRTTPVCRR